MEKIRRLILTYICSDQSSNFKNLKISSDQSYYFQNSKIDRNTYIMRNSQSLNLWRIRKQRTSLNRATLFPPIKDPLVRHHVKRLGRPLLLDARHPGVEPRHADGAGHFTNCHLGPDHAAAGRRQDHRGGRHAKGSYKLIFLIINISCYLI